MIIDNSDLENKIVEIAIKLINDFDNIVTKIGESSIVCVAKGSTEAGVDIRVLKNKVHGGVRLGYKVGNDTYKRDFNFLLDGEDKVKDFLDKIEPAIKREKELSLMLIESYL